MEKQQLFTDITIKAKSKKSLKKYLESFKSNLPVKWLYSEEKEYKDSDTFKILNKVIRIQTPWYKSDYHNTTFNAGLILGLTDDSITLLKIEFTIPIADDLIMEHLGFVVNIFENEILKPNKDYPFFDHQFSLGGFTDENWHCVDIREARLLRIRSKSDNKIYSLAHGENTVIKDKTIFYTTPNNIALSMNIMKKSFKRSFAMYNKLISSKKDKKIDFKDSERFELFDLFEELQTSIIFGYVAVEAFTNAAIPEDFTFKKINEKGIEETWSKENIERWMQTSEKISKILPEILKSTDIKLELFWTNFKDLEKIRNKIIHQKTINKGTELNQSLYKDMLSPTIFQTIKSSIKVIDFFYNLNNAHPYFPLGMGIAKFQVSEVENISEHFKAVED